MRKWRLKGLHYLPLVTWQVWGRDPIWGLLLLVIYCCVINNPPNLATLNNKHLLLLNFCGSEIWLQHSWMVLARGLMQWESRGHGGCIHRKAWLGPGPASKRVYSHGVWYLILSGCWQDACVPHHVDFCTRLHTVWQLIPQNEQSRGESKEGAAGGFMN